MRVGLGSVRSLTDSSGTVTDRYEYTAFGERLEEGTDPQPYGFTGEPWSSVMELAHHRARWMDPAMGRFLSVDPFEGLPNRPLSLNSYSYAQATATNLRDPSGLYSVGELSAVNAIRGVVSSIQSETGLNLLTAKPLDPDRKISKIFLVILIAQAGPSAFQALKGVFRDAGKAVRKLGSVTRSSRDSIYRRAHRPNDRMGSRAGSCFSAQGHFKSCLQGC